MTRTLLLSLVDIAPGVYELNDGGPPLMVAFHQGKNFAMYWYDNAQEARDEFEEGDILFEGVYVKSMGWHINEGEAISVTKVLELPKEENETIT